MGKRTAQKDAIKDITSDSQVNSYFPYRWSLASPTINIYFYLFLYNGTPHLKSLKSQNRKAALGRPAIKLLGGLNPGLAILRLANSLTQPNSKWVTVMNKKRSGMGSAFLMLSPRYSGPLIPTACMAVRNLYLHFLACSSKTLCCGQALKKFMRGHNNFYRHRREIITELLSKLFPI